MLQGAQGFISNSVSYRNLAGGSTILTPSSSLSETEIVSLFGRLIMTMTIDSYLPLQRDKMVLRILRKMKSVLLPLRCICLENLE